MKPSEEAKRNIAVSILLGLILAIAVLFMFGCTTPPDKKNYIGQADSCYLFSECMYFNQKNADKSICADYAKECRAYGRFNFCKDGKNLPESMRFQECWDKLNSK